MKAAKKVEARWPPYAILIRHKIRVAEKMWTILWK